MRFTSPLLLLASFTVSVISTPFEPRALSPELEVARLISRSAEAGEIKVTRGFNASAKQSPQLKAVLAFLDGLASYDLGTLNKTLGPTYTHAFWPATFSKARNYPPYFTRSQIINVVKSTVWGLLDGLKAVIELTIEAGDTIVLHTTAPATTKGKYTGTPYAQEYINIFTVERQKDGTYKMASTREMLDSNFSLKFYADEMAAAAAAGHPVSPDY